MKRTAMLGALLLGGLTTAAVASPHEGEKGEQTPIQEYRHDMMENLGIHMKGASMILKGEIDRSGDLIHHARGLNQQSKFICELFPEGSGPDAGDTRALAAVWDNPQQYEQECQDFVEATTKLVEVAEGGDMAAFGEAFKATGKSCKSCHDDFRAEEDE